MTPQFPSKQAPWHPTQFSQSPSAALSYFPEMHWWSDISSLSKVTSIWGKPEVAEYQTWAVGGLSHLSYLIFHEKNSAQVVIHEQLHCRDEAANHQLPIAVAFWIIWIVSVEECSSLTQNIVQICCSSCSVILNVMTTQYTCLLNGIYHPYWLIQWSHHCSCMCIPVHSPWLPGYMDVTHTVLIY